MTDEILKPFPPPPHPHVPPESSKKLFMYQMTRGGIVCDAEIAEQIAAILLATHWGPEELERQKPFVITKHDEIWHVDGSWNRDFQEVGKGPFFARLWAFDGRVLELGLYLSPGPYPEHIQKIIRENKQAAKPVDS